MPHDVSIAHESAALRQPSCAPLNTRPAVWLWRRSSPRPGRYPNLPLSTNRRNSPKGDSDDWQLSRFNFHRQERRATADGYGGKSRAFR